MPWLRRRSRAAWSARVETGEVQCARCSRPIAPGTPWVLARVPETSGMRWPRHRDWCSLIPL